MLRSSRVAVAGAAFIVPCLPSSISRAHRRQMASKGDREIPQRLAGRRFDRPGAQWRLRSIRQGGRSYRTQLLHAKLRRGCGEAHDASAKLPFPGQRAANDT
jgi:hypothetical protein